MPHRNQFLAEPESAGAVVRRGAPPAALSLHLPARQLAGLLGVAGWLHHGRSQLAVRDALRTLGFVERDQASSLVRILGWFGHNRIENKNVAQGAVKIIAALPRGDILNNLLADLNEIDNKFLTPLLSRSANRSDRVSNESESPEPEPEPNPELNPDPEQAVAPGAPPSAKRHGERKGAMPAEDWAPTPDDIAFAAAAGLAVPAIHAEAEKFKDYWIAVPGARGRKLDWLATWKNWIRRCVEQLTAHPPGPLATPDPLAHWGEEESHANH
ncbi:MAG: hypothetical protein QF449_14960 [Alphaproteobacteria bacterium]|nr:hypothetical protein [Alphaproteobacteria bacterium]MDP6819322.1 hypothetical protein [Alphaproteobacteria bacterium]